jgi:hypothetical protein
VPADVSIIVSTNLKVRSLLFNRALDKVREALAIPQGIAFFVADEKSTG